MKTRTGPAGPGPKPRQKPEEDVWGLPLRDLLFLRVAAKSFVEGLRPEVWADPAMTSQFLKPALDLVQNSVRKQRLSVTSDAIESYLRRAIADERELRAARERDLGQPRRDR